MVTDRYTFRVLTRSRDAALWESGGKFYAGAGAVGKQFEDHLNALGAEGYHVVHSGEREIVLQRREPTADGEV